MKKYLFLALALIVSLSITAQQARQEISSNVQLSGSNYLAYPGPQKALTKAPKGEKPFYISHYGRHGSRFLIGKDDYEKPLKIFREAHKAGKLTEEGKDVYNRLKLIAADASNRYGELTPLGALQHRQIAKRMFERFPEVFNGETNVEARSTIVIRCILSMENEMQQLMALNPKLHIFHDASEHDMYYMNFGDKELSEKKMMGDEKISYREFYQRHIHPDRLMKALFNDNDYVNHTFDKYDMMTKLFELACNMQSTELRDKVILYNIFTTDEIYDNWQLENAWWYINYGPSPISGGMQPFSQRNLLTNILNTADSCIALAHPGATMRFGHETMVMPLTCLLELNNSNMKVSDFEKLADSGWINYKIFPMGCNIQFIFYRKDVNDKNILVKVLLNEDEAHLPISTDTWPYYKWSDVENFYRTKLASYKQ